jgi:hypothetical protein
MKHDRAAAPPALCRAAGALLALASCIARPSAPHGEPANASGALAWQDRYDLDGDGARDRIEVGFTGGAHCCYTLAIVSGRTGVRTELPFELDGGYVGGLDLSQPERFAVAVAPSGVAHLVIEVATYGGEPQPLPAEWAALGVTSHRIAVSLTGGLTIENLGWRCDQALLAIQRGLWAAWEGLPGDCTPHAVFAALDAVPTIRRAGLIGAEPLRVLDYLAVRSSDESLVVAHVETTGSHARIPDAAAGTPVRLVRLDLLSPIEAAAAAAALAARPHQSLPHEIYWRSGLAVRVDESGGAPTALGLVAAGDSDAYVQHLQWSP